MSTDSSKTRRAVSLALALMFTWPRRPARGGSTAESLGEPGVRPARADVPQLHFGTTGRTKARNTRLRARLGVLGLIAALIGVPGATAGWDFVTGAVSRGERDAATADLSGITTSESAAGMLRFRRNVFKNRPTPSPTRTREPVEQPAAEAPASSEPVAAPSGSVTEVLYAAAAEFGIDPGYLVSVASCESGLNPGAVNPAGYHGLFQFDHATWGAYGYGSIYDAAAQARTAARMLAAGMASRWPNCA